MKPAPGVHEILGIPADYWLKLKRNLYGLKQAPRNWTITFINWLTEAEGFEKASIDDCMYFKEYEVDGKKCFILMLMYVDDDVIISNDRAGLDMFKKSMHEKKKFEISDKKDIKNISRNTNRT